MNKIFSVQAAALSLAAVVTLTLLGSVSGVANRQYDDAIVAQTPIATVATQQVVIVGKRLPRA